MAAHLDSALAAMAEEFNQRYEEKRCLSLIHALWQSDRHSDYTAFRRTAEIAAEQLRRAGAQQVEIFPCPADGTSRVQAWTMPLAWEAKDAVLRVRTPREEIVCDRSVEPLSCAMWSEPTPAGGIEGPLVVIDDPAALSSAGKRRLNGAFILTGRNPRGEMKRLASSAGAACLISHFVPHRERHADDTVGWCNGWSDDAGGWALTANDSRMTGFMISPAAGARLRRLAAEGTVFCHALVTGTIGPGVLPAVTAVVPGETGEEILLVGHLYEIGANDNASGCGVMIEAVRMMAGLPRPARTVRILLCSECYGSYSFFTARPELLRRTVAGLNVDCAGEPETEGMPLLWHRTPEAFPSAVDTLFRAALRATEKVPGGRRARESFHSLSDNAVCDPLAGVPTPILMRAPWTWHTSKDDWSQLSPASVRRSAVATAVYARWLAEADGEKADLLAQAAADEARTETLSERYCGEDEEHLPEERLSFFVDRCRARVLWTARLGATRAAALAGGLSEMNLSALLAPEDGGEDERRLVVARRFWGAPTFDGIPFDQRDGFADPRWASPYISATYWADGKRTIAEISALVRLELGKQPERLLSFFRVLEKAGLVSLVPQTDRTAANG